MTQQANRVKHTFQTDSAQLDFSYKIQNKLKTFKDLVGDAGWARLTKDIRARFATSATTSPVLYNGEMEHVKCSPIGWVMAQAARLIGTPLAPYLGKNIPIHVRVFKNELTDGTVWEREYFFPNKKPITVRSTKHFTENYFLVECVGGGVGMKLNVFEQDQKLHFKSTQYFWKGLGFTIPIPALLTPGIAHVIHTDEGDGLFRFTMTIHHKIFGTTFFQDGLFKEEEK